MKTALTFDFLIGHYDNCGLNLEIDINNKSRIKFSNLSIDKLKFTLDIDLPCKIKFNVTGKLDKNPVVDELGNIIKDQFIEFKSLVIEEVNGCVLDSWFFPDTHLYFQTTTGIGSKTYWSQNGTATLDLDEDDIIIWLLNHKNLIFTAK
jgi:hypothetical protein